MTRRRPRTTKAAAAQALGERCRHIGNGGRCRKAAILNHACIGHQQPRQAGPGELYAIAQALGNTRITSRPA